MKCDVWGLRKYSQGGGRMNARDRTARAPEWAERMTHMVSDEEEKQRLSPQASCAGMFPEMGGGT